MAFPVVNWTDRTSDTVDGGTSIPGLAEPTGAAAGDGLLLFWASDGDPTSVTVDGFWTNILLVDFTQVSCGVWFGVRGASAPDYEVSWTTNEDAGSSAVHVDAGTFDAAAMVDLAEVVQATGIVSPIDFGPMALAAGPDRHVIAFGAGDGTGAWTPIDNGFTNPVVANWTEEFDENFTAGGGRAAYTAHSVETTLAAPALRSSRADDDWISSMFAIEPATAGQTIAIVAATEGEAAGAITVLKPIIETVVAAAESELAEALAGIKVVDLGNAAEVEAAIALSARKTVSVGDAAEGETAETIAAIKGITEAILAASEGETATALAAAKQASLGAAVEGESGETIGALKPIIQAILVAVEVEAAQVIPIDQGAGQTIPIGAASEDESAVVVAVVHPIIKPIGPAIEGEVAETVAVLKPIIVPVVGASESEIAEAAEAVKHAAIAAAVEAELASVVVAVHPIILAIGAASETEIAEAITAIVTLPGYWDTDATGYTPAATVFTVHRREGGT